MVEHELRVEDPSAYNNFLRLNVTEFSEFLSLVEGRISKADTLMRQSLSAERKLMTTLRFLATGYMKVRFIPEVCNAIYYALHHVIQVPATEAEWESISHDFLNLWQVPNRIGAVDGKHVNFRAPRNMGMWCSEKVNYMKVLINNTLNIPENKPLPYREMSVPYVLLADQAFPLMHRIIKPYPQLSRGRRVVESAFGILCNRFRVLLTTINLNADKVEKIVLACCALHNYLCSKGPQSVDNQEINSVPLKPIDLEHACQTWWRTIRDSYKKNKKKMGTGSAATSKSKYDTRLQFLDESFSER
ncbi:hypothetical protein J437_LFUL000190, partial [Ladona fulva]